MSAKNEHGLTAQQERFAQEVAQGKSLADAYRAAYPKARNWQQKSVHEKSSALAADVKVQSRLAQLRAVVADRAEVTAVQVIREIARVAFADPRRLVDGNGNLIPLHRLDDDTAAALSSVEVDEYGKVKYRLWDKGAAQEKLAKYLGLYEKDNRQQTDPMTELVKAITGAVVGAKGIDLIEDGDD